MLNCYSCRRGFSLSKFSAHSKFRMYFKYAVFTKGRNFEITEDIDSINFFFNNWGEFNCRQGFKRYEPPCYDTTISLDYKIDVGFCQAIQGSYLDKNMGFHQLFAAAQGDLSDEETNELNEKLKDVLRPYADKIAIKNPESHEWFISLSKDISIEKLSSYQAYLKGLLICLTNDFNTSIQKIIIKTKEEDGSLACHYVIHETDVKTDEINYDQMMQEFNFKSFSEEEWKIIFNNLFNKDKTRLFDNFFFIIQEDVRENRLTPFHIARLLDCFGAMAQNRGYENQEKYQKLLGDLLDGIELKLKNNVENYIDAQLEGIECNNKGDDKEKNRGKKLSNLRAQIVHFNEKNNSGINKNGLKLHKIFRLCVMDYVLENLGFDEEKRIKYKERILKSFNLSI